jgi:hypothetical protein
VVDTDTPLDAEQILEAFAQHAVDYVIVGGLAVQTHGHVRTTVGIDIYPSPDPSDLARLAGALNALDARSLNPWERRHEDRRHRNRQSRRSDQHEACERPSCRPRRHRSAD